MCQEMRSPRAASAAPRAPPTQEGGCFPGLRGRRRGSRCTWGTEGRCLNRALGSPGRRGAGGGPGRQFWLKCSLSHQPCSGCGGAPTSGARFAPVPESRARLLASPGHAQWPFADAAAELGGARRGWTHGSGRARVGLSHLSRSAGRPAATPRLRGNRERGLTQPRAVPAGLGRVRLSPGQLLFLQSSATPVPDPLRSWIASSRGSSTSPKPQVAPSFPTLPGQCK
ncbi:uncharacterized protein LOC102899373 [Felis catus]|uniref:uncharacterized protein LOC102899373 n=1 Tax=Felis catus TaxID=9685 RepID=UPI001D19C975|nr:uncharacterized protein LOC102899373 [Felis catus]